MPCFFVFCSSFCSMLMLWLHAHMLDIMSMVMSYLDLHVCMHVLCFYAYIRVFTCFYAWIHFLPCLCAKFLYVFMLVSMLISMFSHAYVLASMFSTCFLLYSMCLCTPCHVCMPRPRLCLSCHVLL